MKYIDADKLIERLEDMKQAEYENCGGVNSKTGVLQEVQELIASLQREQPKVQNGKFVFPKYLYARTKDNKTIDMSYAPQDMTAVEYIRNNFVEQEQPEVDLEREMIAYMERHFHIRYDETLEVGNDPLTTHDFEEIARHFAEWGAIHLNARKEE